MSHITKSTTTPTVSLARGYKWISIRVKQSLPHLNHEPLMNCKEFWDLQISIEDLVLWQLLLQLCKSRTLRWDGSAWNAFQTLKDCLTSVSIPWYPGPFLLFMPIDGIIKNTTKMHTYVFLCFKIDLHSKKLWSRDQDILVIKAGIEEWRHWLDGAEHPFLILNSHCNLEHLKLATLLNPQAQWWLYLSPDLRPGFCQEFVTVTLKQLDQILPPIQWEVMGDITRICFCCCCCFFFFTFCTNRLLWYTIVMCYYKMARGHSG